MKKIISTILLIIFILLFTFSVYAETVYYTLGDSDLDNYVTIVDATNIQKHLANISILNKTQLVVADADQDGTISITDATAIQKSLAKMLTLGTISVVENEEGWSPVLKP